MTLGSQRKTRQVVWWDMDEYRIQRIDFSANRVIPMPGQVLGPLAETRIFDKSIIQFPDTNFIRICPQ